MESSECRLINGILVVPAQDFRLEMLGDLKLVKAVRGSSRKAAPDFRPRYLDLVTAFDIETSRLAWLDPEQSVMYIWQFGIRPDLVVVGRTWDEFRHFVSLIDAYCESYEEELRHNGNKRWRVRLACWVHNLSYEFQFLRGIFPLSGRDVFAMDMRKVVKVQIGHIEMRCSYIHSNMSLSQFTTKYKAQHVKLSGEEFEYAKVRYPWTEMTDRELEYCITDVSGLIEALQNEMELDGDTIETIPMTSTGYVRRDAKKAMQHFNHFQLWEMQPNPELYEAEREAFRGGNTHANRFYAGRVLENVTSMDRSSSYPDVLVNCKFPMSPFYHKGPVSRRYYNRCVDVRENAAIIRISLTNVRLRDPWCGCPYLSTDKCRHILTRDPATGHGKGYCAADNGRILSCDYLETTVTDVDMRIIDSMYEYDEICIFDSWFCRYGYLPEMFRNLVRAYYRMKTELKGNEDRAMEYEKIKAKINALYGMCAMDPVRDVISFLDGDFFKEEINLDKALTKNARKNFLVYSWGVWVTALARRELQLAIDAAGDQFVYCDTDSVKYVGEVDFSTINSDLYERSRQNGAYAVNANGEVHFMGVYELDGKYSQFATLGAKKYAYVDGKGLHITIAGVSKKTGADELQQMGGIQAFQEGLTFRAAGGTESLYNDHPDLPPLEIDGHRLEITSNVVIRDSTYTLGITEEYRYILHNAALFRELYKTLEWY